MKKTPLIAVLGASLLSACGGGSSDGSPAPEVAPSTAATVALSGIAAKGLMDGADVKVHPIATDGSVDLATVLASTTTAANGSYTLSFSGTKDQPYVVRVSANANTTHRDEVSGESQALPVGFSMRSLVIPAASGAVSTSASITPFSEMAVAAAAKASGGVSAANAAQAVSTVTQLLGFDPTKVAATSTGAAATDDEKKLAVMLTAVSQMANSGDLGCNTGAAGDKVKCVVDALGAAASTSSIKLETGSGEGATNVSAVLNSAVTTVLAKPELVGTISGSLLTTVAANLGCTSNCNAAATGTTPTVDASAQAIAGAKLLFTQLKSDWTALFSRGGASGIATGAANVQAFKFDQAMRDVHLPVRTLLTDSGALLLGIDLYNDYKAGRTNTPSRGRAEGSVPNDGSADFSNTFGAAGCTLYQDADTQVTATTPNNANFIGCSARYYLSRSFNPVVTSEYRHGFTITPLADGGFGWQTRARLRRTSGNGTLLSNAALQTDAAGAPLAPFTGTVTTTLTGGSVTGFTLQGELAAGFKEGGSQLVNHKHSINLSGTRSFSASQPKDGSSSVTGSLVAMDSSGATLSTLTVKQATSKELPVSRDANENDVAPGSATAVRTAGGTLSAVTVNLVFTKADAEFEGILSMPTSSWDKSGTSLQPTELRLSGMLRNIGNGSTTEFFSGSFTVKSSGFANYEATAPYSASNRYTQSLSFVGQVSAPNRPLLELSLGAEQLIDSDDGSTQSLSLQYRSIVNGAPRLVVTVAGTREGGSSTVNRFRLAEAGANLSLSWLDGASAVELVHGDSRVIGSVNASSGVVTFSDGSLVSLDVGL
jgi:hypothetical protein